MMFNKARTRIGFLKKRVLCELEPSDLYKF